MADIKTHLRELSVATTIGLLKEGVEFSISDFYDSSKFFAFASTVITNDISGATNILSYKHFSEDLRNIIDNGSKLGHTIFNNKYFKIHKSDIVKWIGNDTQKDNPVDIVIGDYGFSLKEESFILENMGLYKLLNCYTGSTYKKRHIFKDYAPQEYEEWFSVTWNALLKYLLNNGSTWCLLNKHKQKESRIRLNKNNIELEFLVRGEVIAKSILPNNCTIGLFESSTNSIIREEVFSKFINNNLGNNTEYNNAKKNCAIAATDSLALELNRNLNYESGLPRFLRIHDSEYYYAKSTRTETTLYKVPSLASFGRDIIIAICSR